MTHGDGDGNDYQILIPVKNEMSMRNFYKIGDGGGICNPAPFRPSLLPFLKVSDTAYNWVQRLYN